MRAGILRKRAQSTMEYAIVVTAIIVVVIVAARMFLQPSVANIIQKASNEAGNSAETWLNISTN